MLSPCVEASSSRGPAPSPQGQVKEEQNRAESSGLEDTESCLLSPTFEKSDVTEPFSDSLLEELSPSTMLEGTCGVYLLKNKAGEDVGIFKPMDEEYVPEEAEKWALVKGHNSYRERAAFLVSNELGGYTGVPRTIITTLRHPTFEGGEKRGSLQRFVPASTDMSDLGPAGIPVDEVHKIGIVDLLLFNVDRHEGNVLLRTKTKDGESTTRELVPIDHGLCLPVIVTRESGPVRSLMMDLFFAWQSWPQAKEAFGARALRFLSALSPKAVNSIVKLLKSDLGHNAIPAAALTTLKLGALLLRMCVEAGKTLNAIADFVRIFLADVLEDAWALAAHEDRLASPPSPPQDLEAAPPSHVTTLVVRDPAAADVEELAYEAWERRLLAAFQVRLRAALNLVPMLDSAEGAGSPALMVSVARREESPIERLDSPPCSPAVDCRVHQLQPGSDARGAAGCRHQGSLTLLPDHPCGLPPSLELAAAQSAVDLFGVHAEASLCAHAEASPCKQEVAAEVVSSAAHVA